MLQTSFTIFAILWYLISVSHADKCNCNCQLDRSSISVCKIVEGLQEKINANTKKLEDWEKYRPFVETFKDRWKNEISDMVEMTINKYISEGRFHPKLEPLVMPNGYETQGDSNVISGLSKDGNDLVHDLRAKLEMVKNRTLEVEEELNGERQARIRLEQELKETRSSLISITDRINATGPVDAVMDQVKTVIQSSLEDMNKNLYEDHLKKLYDKVDGVAYKNETKNLIERVEHVEAELRDSYNTSIVSKLAEDLNTTKKNLNELRNSLRNNIIPLIETLDNSIEGILVTRIEPLEVESIRKDTVDELERNMKSLLNNTELLFKSALIDVWSDINDIRKRTIERMLKCQPLDLSKRPDLILERNVDETITFKCADKKRLVGPTDTRCMYYGYWSHVILPTCTDWF